MLRVLVGLASALCTADAAGAWSVATGAAKQSPAKQSPASQPLEVPAPDSGDCGAGRFMRVKACVLCPAGKHSHAAWNICHKCHKGKKSTMGSKACVHKHHDTPDVEAKRARGELPQAHRFTREFFKPTTKAPTEDPTTIKKGGCQPGTYLSKKTWHHPTGCYKCPASKYGAVDNHTGVCRECPTGKMQSKYGKLTCYKIKVTSAPTPAPTPAELGCPLGQFRPAPKVCRRCPSGKYGIVLDHNGEQNTNGCDMCTVGKYQRKYGQTLCMWCPEGRHSEMPGATKCHEGAQADVAVDDGALTAASQREVGATKQRAGTKCPSGKYTNWAAGATYCIECPPGKYQRLSGYLLCNDCPDGMYAPLHGVLKCSTCPKGEWSSDDHTNCQKDDESRHPAGDKRNAGGKKSDDICPPGKFHYHIVSSSYDQNSVNDRHGKGVCTHCPAGKYQNIADLKHCNDCSSGTYQHRNGAIDCTPCPHGLYSNRLSTGCTPNAPAGTRPKPKGSAPLKTPVMTPGKNSKDGVKCPAGRYTFVLDRKHYCMSCRVGQYQDVPDQMACKKCAIGRYTPVDTSTACIPCGPTTGGACKTADTKCDCDPTKQAAKWISCVVDSDGSHVHELNLKPLTLQMGRGDGSDKEDHRCANIGDKMCQCCECVVDQQPANIVSLGEGYYWLKPPFLDNGGQSYKVSSLAECEKACSDDKTCKTGTYVTSFSGRGECWLSKSVNTVGEACVEQCESFARREGEQDPFKEHFTFDEPVVASRRRRGLLDLFKFNQKAGGIPDAADDDEDEADSSTTRP